MVNQMKIERDDKKNCHCQGKICRLTTEQLTVKTKLLSSLKLDSKDLTSIYILN
jgi:hypothetical protein